jgi:hypothetical protein
MVRAIEAAGVDVRKVASTVHSLTVRAWKPVAATE